MIKVDWDEEGEGCRVHVYGELTIEHAGEFKAVLYGALVGNSPVQVDLSKVNEADLTCLQILCSACITSYMRKTPITINGLSGMVMRTIDNGGLRRLPDSGDGCCWISGGYHG